MVAPPQRRVRILDIDPDLGDDLGPEALAEVAQTVTLPALDLDVGPWVPGELPVRGPVIGALVVSGLLTRDVELTDRVCTHIFGPRDFVSLNRLEYTSLPLSVEFSALVPTRLALLDDTVLAAARRWPQLLGRLLDSATSQLGRLSADQAISQLPRVEDRIVSVFWHFADRWGTRRKEDVHIDLPLTHEALGRLIGARRPTVSLGLRQLATDGSLRREDDGWVLSLDSVASLGGQARVRPAAARSRPVPLPTDGALAERLSALRANLDAERERTLTTMAHNRAVREQVALARAQRASAPAA